MDSDEDDPLWRIVNVHGQESHLPPEALHDVVDAVFDKDNPDTVQEVQADHEPKKLYNGLCPSGDGSRNRLCAHQHTYDQCKWKRIHVFQKVRMLL